MPDLKTREELIARINEIFYKNGLEYITAEQTNTVLQLLLANQPILEEINYLEKIGSPVKDRVILAAADGTLKQSDVLISQITGLDLTRMKFTAEGGLAVYMRNLTPGSLYKGTICTAVQGALSMQEFIQEFKPTGASLTNSDNYCYYLKVRNYYSGGTMHFQVNIYKDLAMTELVGHVPDMDLSGSAIQDPQTIVEDNASGLTGTVRSGTVATPTNALYDDYTFWPLNAVSMAIPSASFKHMIAYEDIAYGYEGWIVTAGVADVLMVDANAAEFGYFAYMDGNGRAKSASALDISSLANYIKYFGRFVDKQAGGTNVLARMILK